MTSNSFLYHPSRRVLAVCGILAVLGTLTFVAGIVLSPARAWANFLLVSYYLLGLGLGGLVLMALQYVSGAGWGVALRRVPEAMAVALPAGAAGVLLVLFAYPSLYPAAETDQPGAVFRHLWLDRPVLLARALLYVALWLGLALALVRTSRRQDRDGDPVHTRTNVRLSALFLVIFAVTCWLSSYDWIMALEPEWSSTIFGVYNFAGHFLSALAACIVLAVWLRWQGPWRGVLRPAHLHDLGKLLFGFSCFWMYIWFCQYMLIWYVNNPEETTYFLRRAHGEWRSLFCLNVLLNWGVPFFALLSSRAKQSARLLGTVALIVLAGRWLDLYLMIVPTVGEPMQDFAVWEIGLLAGAAGGFFLIVFRALGQAPCVPVKDPYLEESCPTEMLAERT